MFKKKNGKFFGFSLIELMISLIIISLVAAAFAPIITKKLSKSSVIVGSNLSEITDECSEIDSDGDCTLCTKKYCLTCKKNCESNQYLNVKACKCSSCSDYDNQGNTNGATCTSCTRDKCTFCYGGYIENGKCITCPYDTYCDGVNKLTSCPAESYCDSYGVHACRDVYDLQCSSCNKTSCLTCDTRYSLVNGKCTKCKVTGDCMDCARDVNYCDKCEGKYVADSNGQCSILCSNQIENCTTCKSATQCENCADGYVVNISGKCSKCSVSNCKECKAGTLSFSQQCSFCYSGYYLANGKCQACTTLDANCASCRDGKCISCKKGYSFDKNYVCQKIEDNTKFKCSDSNFMRIGNLCFTRKNMGEDTSLPIPSGIITASAESGVCYSESTKCCWKSTKGYMYCNWTAANAICANFSFNGNWRLPTTTELSEYARYSSDGLGDEGLGFAVGTNTDRMVRPCKNAIDDGCYGSYVWTSNDISERAYIGTYMYGTYKIWPFYKNNAFTVRCVQDMTTF